MNVIYRNLAVMSAATLLVVGTGNLNAQDQQAQPRQRQGGGQGGGGNFDPEQMRVRMMERYREQLDVKEDDEWKALAAQIEKVAAARRQVGTSGGGMAFGRGGGGPGGGGGGQGGGGRRGFGGADPLPEAEALQKAIDAKASKDEIVAKLARLREARKEKELALEKAQDELRKSLTSKQEAVAVLLGLLK